MTCLAIRANLEAMLNVVFLIIRPQLGRARQLDPLIIMYSPSTA
jgi:hypothetical protein